MPIIAYGSEPNDVAKALLEQVSRKRIGRPVARRDAFLKLITDYPGLYMKEACSLLRINPRTVKRWNKIASFREAYEDAQGLRFAELYQILEFDWLGGTDSRPIKRYLFNFDPEYKNRIGYLNWRRRAIVFLRQHGEL